MIELSGWKRKAILIFKSEKRLGAKQVISHYASKSFDEMKTTLITDESGELASIENKPRIKDLTGHLNKIKKEFIGQSELCYYHATLVVLLRRDYKPEQTFQAFEQLWEAQPDYLLSHLPLRWIVSACDTFVDYLPNTLRASLLMNVTTMVNTIRVYETQKFLYYPAAISSSTIKTQNINRLYDKDLPLYDGMTLFRIGSDDTLKNMRLRYERFGTQDALATKVLLAVFDRVQTLDTAFATMKQLHKYENSQWWTDNVNASQ